MSTIKYIVPVGATVALAFGVVGCNTAEDYYQGPAPVVSSIEPALESGNVGTALILPRIANLDDRTEEEDLLLDSVDIEIHGDFSACTRPIVMFGSRNAVIIPPAEGDADDSLIRVLSPPGPVSGGPVKVQVGCEGGISAENVTYDYVLGEVDLEAAEILGKRQEDAYANEYGTFAMFYQAGPFANWPDPVGYGFFFDEISERAGLFYEQNPTTVYGGHQEGEAQTARIIPQIPALEYEAPEHGDRLGGGDAMYFFRKREMSLGTAAPVTRQGRKAVSQFGDGPAAPTAQVANDQAVWLVVRHELDSGAPALRYLRVDQSVGAWCSSDPTRRHCGQSDDEDQRLDDVRLPISFDWTWMTPHRPTQGGGFSWHDLEGFENVSPQFYAFSQCFQGDLSDQRRPDREECLQGHDGIELESGDYSGYLCASSDTNENLNPDEYFLPPWEEDGFCRVMERFDHLYIHQGRDYVDLPEIVLGKWDFDTENSYYDGTTATIGDNVFPMDVPTWVAYEGAFSEGAQIPSKSWIDPETPMSLQDRLLAAIPDELPTAYPGCLHEADECAGYDEHPYLLTPETDLIGSWIGDSESQKYGLPPNLSGEAGVGDWRIPMPTDADANGFEDTYFNVTLEVRDFDKPAGIGNTTVWKVSTFAWAGDGFITIPADVLATIPPVQNVDPPEGETQRGSNMIGIFNLEIHRPHSWRLGDGFRDPDGRLVMDVNNIQTYYFHNQRSCFDGIDNDGDGTCDMGECPDPANEGSLLPADPACEGAGYDDEYWETGECQDGEDNDGDGFVDMADPDCDDPSDIQETGKCLDGLDNDGDGWIDDEDPGCAEDDEAPGELSFVRAGTRVGAEPYSFTSDCNDGIDDDGDGLVDSMDPGCEDGYDADEFHEDTCSDQIDNNGDGWVDHDDIGCDPSIAQNEGRGGEWNWPEELPILGNGRECSNYDAASGFTDMVDDDGDGAANADDPECAWGNDSSGESTEPQACADHIDNDGDGWVDGDDPQCGVMLDSETDGPTTTCADGLDNDSDGWIDAEDPDCATGVAAEALVATFLQCNDEVDNDGDGFIDAEDPECASGKDNHEEP